MKKSEGTAKQVELRRLDGEIQGFRRAIFIIGLKHQQLMEDLAYKMLSLEKKRDALEKQEPTHDA